MCGKERETMCARMTIAFPALRATQDPLVSRLVDVTSN